MDTTSETCFMSFFPLLSSKGFPVHREEPLKKNGDIEKYRASLFCYFIALLSLGTIKIHWSL